MAKRSQDAAETVVVNIKDVPVDIHGRFKARAARARCTFSELFIRLYLFHDDMLKEARKGGAVASVIRSALKRHELREEADS